MREHSILMLHFRNNRILLYQDKKILIFPYFHVVQYKKVMAHIIMTACISLSNTKYQNGGLCMETLLENMITYEVGIKLVIAATLSLVIGIERELKKKPVGLKTSLVIATFSCLLTIISIETAYSTPPREDINITMDPLRLAAQIVSGIGFLGAGVILRRGNDSITGLTTAAMIWGAAGIGIAVGAGFYMDATLAVVIIVFGIEILSPFLMKIGPKRIRMREILLKVQIDDDNNTESFLLFLKDNNIIIENIRIKDVHLKNNSVLHELDLRLSLIVSDNLLSFYRSLRELSYIEKIEMEILN